MGLFEAYNQWKVSRYENHVSNMESQNKCPDCNGRGYHSYPANEFVYYSNPSECPGCNGSGLFTDWTGLK
ncbi:hypothetical protein B1NLA3E_18365 [Bacillus sp. 1NLA3E]|nr:hypothetical protein B1NLA3E_18365 [Bacillus sp. 1NLA3E]